MSVKVKNPKTKQKFVRINIDQKLDNYFNLYEKEYPLLNRADIVKMLLSQSIRQNQKSQTFKQILKNSTFLKPQDEDAQFDFLTKQGF